MYLIHDITVVQMAKNPRKISDKNSATEDNADRIDLRVAAQLLGYTNSRSLKLLRERGHLIEGVHWFRTGPNRIQYSRMACKHYQENEPDVHLDWLRVNFPAQMSNADVVEREVS
jgi:hypothetical protein